MNLFNTFFLSFGRLVLFSLRLGDRWTGWQLRAIGFRTSHNQSQRCPLVSALKLSGSLVFERERLRFREPRRLPNFRSGE